MADTPLAFDYIIVGAGSAGCVLAYHLASDPSIRVLLIEAGGSDNDPLIQIPWGWGQLPAKPQYDWGYQTEPEPHLGGRRIDCRRGKVLGGSSSINAMAYVRGHPGDFDRWHEQGAPGWSFKDVLPYFKRSETWEKGGDTHRGSDGPLLVTENKFKDPLIDAAFEGGAAAGLSILDDYNGAHNEGIGTFQWTIGKGRRSSTSAC